MCVRIWGLLLGSLVLEWGVDCVDLEQVEELVRQWSPLVWLAPEEKYLPLSVEEYLAHVRLASRNGTEIGKGNLDRLPPDVLKKAILIPDVPLDTLMNDTSSFIYGKHPNSHRVTTYAFVKQCEVNTQKDDENEEKSLSFYVSYWLFYPYNMGKEFCLIGSVPTLKLFNTCLGGSKILGNHLGDWEHLSLSFSKRGIPFKLYLAIHDTGVYYTYNETGRYFEFSHQRKGILKVPKFPQIVRTQGQHPVVFSANGSHGLWSASGDFDFVRIPKLTDRNGYGTPWKTWGDIKTYHIDTSPLPFWATYPGKWGNPKQNCFLPKPLGICEFAQGPVGPLWHKQDFVCPSVH